MATCRCDVGQRLEAWFIGGGLKRAEAIVLLQRSASRLSQRVSAFTALMSENPHVAVGGALRVLSAGVVLESTSSDAARAAMSRPERTARRRKCFAADRLPDILPLDRGSHPVKNGRTRPSRVEPVPTISQSL